MTKLCVNPGCRKEIADDDAFCGFCQTRQVPEDTKNEKPSNPTVEETAPQVTAKSADMPTQSETIVSQVKEKIGIGLKIAETLPAQHRNIEEQHRNAQAEVLKRHQEDLDGIARNRSDIEDLRQKALPKMRELEIGHLFNEKAKQPDDANALHPSADISNLIEEARALQEAAYKKSITRFVIFWQMTIFPLLLICGLAITMIFATRILDNFSTSSLIMTISSIVIIGQLVLLSSYMLTLSLRKPYIELAQRISQAECWIERRKRDLETEYNRRHVDLLNRHSNEIKSFLAKAAYQVSVAQQAFEDFIASTSFMGAPWDPPIWSDWAPAKEASPAIRIGTLRADTSALKTILPELKHDFSFPALFQFTGGRCLLVKASGTGKEAASRAVQSVISRLLATIPPGKVNFTFVDPVGLGQNVASFMHLGDYDKSLVNSRAWTEPQHIEQRLSELTEHMETVIQKYLRNQHATIEEYNRKAPVVEPYRVLVVMDFPVNFTENSARRLVSIAQNGPRCGVHTFIVMDTDKPLPYGFTVPDLDHVSSIVSYNGGRFLSETAGHRKCALAMDSPPQKTLFDRILDTYGEIAKTAMKVEVPYEKILQLAELSPTLPWQWHTDDDVRVPMGSAGAKEVQFLTFGKGMAHHGVIIGRTGSGKSNLMHVIITSIALAYSTDEVQLYLIDFKKGVEFKPYADTLLPHARVIAIESEREFGMSVLEGLDAELQERGDSFRAAGANSLGEYKSKTQKKLPRILLIVDEFQEFFIPEDSICRQANILLERLISKGRAFGIHILLASQSLPGQMPRSTLDQMAVRIALQCSQADSERILAHDNPAARLLSRPGEAIYNASNGLLEANSLFQVAMFTENDRKRCLDIVVDKASENRGRRQKPIIFEGNAPSRIENCAPLNELLESPVWRADATVPTAWLGEAVAIQPPTSVKFRPQSGNHLIAVSRNESEGIGILVAAILSLASQLTPSSARFFIVNLANAESPWANIAEDMANLLPHDIKVVQRRGLPDLFDKLAEDTSQSIESETRQGTVNYVIIFGLHRARDLRQEEGGFSGSFDFDFDKKPRSASPAKQFATLLRDGPETGLHVLAWCDTYGNLKRFLDRKMLGEFAWRVAGAMSHEDSTNFIDDGVASRLDKPHRLILFDEERPGRLEKFRPYSIPEKSWLEHAGATLRKRADK